MAADRANSNGKQADYAPVSSSAPFMRILTNQAFLVKRKASGVFRQYSAFRKFYGIYADYADEKAEFPTTASALLQKC